MFETEKVENQHMQIKVTNTNELKNTGTRLYKLAEDMTREFNYSYSLFHLLQKNSLISGGITRQTSGEIVEKNVKRILTNCCLLAGLGSSDFNIIKGTDDSIIVNNGTGSRRFSVDWHLYIHGLLAIAVECKSYLDSRFLTTTNFEFSGLKTSHNASHIIVAMENAISDESLQFFKGEDNVDSIHFLMAGKRSATKPIYLEEFKKDVLVNEVFSLVANLYSTIKTKV